MSIQEKCRIIEHKKIGPFHYKLLLASDYISSHALPGQFVSLKCADSTDPLLRRPISLHRISKEHKSFELMYEAVGIGTQLLSRFFVGEEIGVFGPLGEGFKLDPQKKIHVLIGGGMGIAPLFSLAEQIKAAGKNAIYILIGAKSKEYLMGEEEFKKITDQIVLSTNDGSYGHKGLTSDLLLNLLENTLPSFDAEISALYSCGPRPMLKAIAEIAFQKKIDCQVAMEERMACGIGACKGCAIKTTKGYKMACKDGPVFDSKEIIWS